METNAGNDLGWSRSNRNEQEAQDRDGWHLLLRGLIRAHWLFFIVNKQTDT